MLKHATVMQILPALVNGGAERGTVDVAAALAKVGAKAIVVSSGGPMVHELERAGAKHIVLDLKSKNPFRMRRNGLALKKLIREHRVDIVHARSRAPAWSGIRAAKLAGAAFMTTFHAPYSFKSEAKKRYNAVMAKGQRVIAISDFIANHARDVYGIENNRLVTIPRGVDLDKFTRGRISEPRTVKLLQQWRVPDDLPILLMPARLSHKKGHELLIEALAQRARKDLYCVMVGATDEDASYRVKLEKLVLQKGLEGHIRIVGMCNDMPAAYNAAALVVAPSTVGEGFGRVPVEAQAMGKPVIASDIGGFTETIVHGETGLLFKSGDSTALAQAIDAVMALDSVQRQALGDHAEANVRQYFTKQKMCDATLDVYADLMRERNFSPRKRSN
jgi:glycosyltransferase involved in cell wall biosynthesis